MSKKTSPKKTLKSLFSKSEVNLRESAEKDGDPSGGEKKKFKFFKFKVKSKGDSAAETPPNEDQRVVSAAEPDKTAEDGDAWSDNSSKRSSLYATAPRSKIKNFSFSELDLRKPKKFGTFSLGLRKKKKKAEENFSQSTMGLHSAGIKARDEEPLDLSQLELDQAKKNVIFSMSQPDLDTFDTFDIPSPPPIASNQPESYFPFTNQSQSFITLNNQPESQEPLMGSSDPSDGREIRRAPIATIRELELDKPMISVSSEATENNTSYLLHDSYAHPPHVEPSPSVDAETAPSFLPSLPLTRLAVPDHKAASVSKSGGLSGDAGALQQSTIKADVSVTKTTSATLSLGQPDTPEIADGTTPSNDYFLTAFGSKINAIIPEPSLDTHTENSALDTQSLRNEVSISHIETSIPEPVTGVTRTVTSVTTGENGTRSATKTYGATYGALYESLFPQSFASEMLSPIPNPGLTERIHPDTNSGLNENLYKCRTETDITDPSLATTLESDSTAPRINDSKAGCTNIDANVNEREVTSTSEGPSTITRSGNDSFTALYESLFPSNFTFHQVPTTSYPEQLPYATQTDSASHRANPPSSLNSASESVGQDDDDTDNIPHSQMTLSHSAVKSNYFYPVRDTVTLKPEISAPPSSDYVRSPGTDTQVAESKQRMVFVTDTATTLTSADPGCPSLVPKPMPAVKSQEIEVKTMEEETFFDPSGQIVGFGTPYNPMPFTVGSDDGSAMEVYYSAKEDIEEESGEDEMYTVDEREGTYLVEDLGLRGEIPQQEKMEEISQREKGDLRLTVMEVKSEGGKMCYEDKRVHLDSLYETQQKLRGERAAVQRQENGTAVILADVGRMRQEERDSKTPWPPMKEEGEEERKEDLLATPVQQVNAVMECESAPPSTKPHGPGEESEGNWIVDIHTRLGREDFTRHTLIPGQEIEYLADKDIRSNKYIHTASSNTEKKDTITRHPTEGREKIDSHTFREAKEPVAPTAEIEKTGAGSKESIQTNRNSMKSASSTLADTNGEERYNSITETAGRVEVVTGTLTRGAELQSDAREIEHNRAAQSSEWADTITQSTDRASALSEQVAFKPSVTAEGTHLPDTQAADSEKDDHPPATQPSLLQRSLKASAVSRPAVEVFSSEIQQTKAELESVGEMNSGYSTLSTTLSIKPSTPPYKSRDESTRFHKVSLVTNTADLSQNTVDFSRPSTTAAESDRTDLGSDTPDYTWRNRFEGVSQYKPDLTEKSSLFDSVDSKVLSSSALPEATVYTRHLISSSSSSPPRETHSSLSNRLSDRTEVYLSRESEPAGVDDWRRSVREQEEPAAPAGEREGQKEREAEKIKSGRESQQLPASGFSSTHRTSHDDDDSCKGDDSSFFSGVFTATRVELVTDPTSSSYSPISPDTGSPYQCDMENFVDTLKSMGPPQRVRSLRGAPQALSTLPPIVEDVPNLAATNSPASLKSPTKSPSAPGAPAEASNGLYTLPADLGLKWSTNKDSLSPLKMMKQGQQEPGNRGLNMPLRATATSSIVMRKSFDSSPEDSPSSLPNGNIFQSSTTGSRLDNSVLFASYRPASTEQTLENGKTNPVSHRSLFRTGSLPELGPSLDRVSMSPRELGGLGTGADPAASRYDRFSFLLNTSSAASLSRVEDRNAWLPPLSINSPPSNNTPTRLLSPTGSIDLQRPSATTDSHFSLFGQTQGTSAGNGALGTHVLQRSFSSEGITGVQQTPLFNSVHEGSHFQSQVPEPEKNVVPKYRAFPDAYLTKEKEHGKLNPRPGKMFIFDRTGMCGQRIEVRSDIIDATPWQLQETISIRVIRGGWVLYEKPNFKGEKIALDEGDIELTCPFNPPEEEEQHLQNGQKENGAQKEVGGQNGEKAEETKPARRFIIGSVRRAVRDYSVPDISLFPEENAEGKKVTFRDTSDDARIFGFPVKANSIIINAGLWLVYTQPFFQGVPRVLEVGGYSNPAAWGVEQPYVGSLHPLKIGEPRVENPNEPKLVVYDKPYFTGKSRTINTTMRDFMTRTDRQQTTFMYNIGSLKVLGGIWVGYEKEGFRGHQYLLEEGEYHDWRVWGGCDSELRSVRVIRADLTDSLMVMYEQPDEEQEELQEENSFEVTEAIPDVELFEYKTTTRSIHVLSGAWIAYSHVDFSGNQYILEKGFYNNCADWGSQDNRICSVQPILLASHGSSKSRNEILLYTEPDFQGECHIHDRNQEAVSDKALAKSCKVVGGSWVLYENKQYSGNQYVLSEGDYPNFTSMGCPPNCTFRSVKSVPTMFCVPSISLFGMECLEGREITTDMEVLSMVEEGFNSHILSLRVNSGCWVICEYSNYRGRQFLLEPIEITNWPKFSSMQTIGSMYPVRQKRRFFRIRNKERGHLMSLQGGVEELKTGRVVVTPQVEDMSDIWYYQDGLIKNKMSPTMSLQVMGNIEPGAKVVLWSETRQPIQTWTAKMRGPITSLTFPGVVLDVKGGKTYDKDHLVMMPENDESPSQLWELELL